MFIRGTFCLLDVLNNVTSFYGSYCANDGEGALNTPDVCIVFEELFVNSYLASTPETTFGSNLTPIP